MFARVLLALMLVLQLAGPLACAGHGAADPTGLGQVVGSRAAICHHGAHDPQPAPDRDGGCCACILCHVAAGCVPATPVVFSLAAPSRVSRVALYSPRSVAKGDRPFVGAAGPRGPPLGI